MDALQSRHLSDLTFQEVRRALQALSSLYVERRGKLSSGAALDGAGKRAAFSLFYGPLHFLLVRDIVRSLPPSARNVSRLIDLGCGGGVSAAAWAVECGRRPEILGLDRNGWAVAEARWTWRQFGLEGEVRRGDLFRFPPQRAGAGILVAFTANELDVPGRNRLLERLLSDAAEGANVLVVEPVARRAAPWWDEWVAAFRAAGGRDDEWRFKADLPESVRLLDRAAGMDHRELTGRSLWIG